MAAVGDESGTCDWVFSSTAAPTTQNPTTTDSPIVNPTTDISGTTDVPTTTDNPGTTDVPTTTGPGNRLDIKIWKIYCVENYIKY